MEKNLICPVVSTKPHEKPDLICPVKKIRKDVIIRLPNCEQQPFFDCMVNEKALYNKLPIGTVTNDTTLNATLVDLINGFKTEIADKSFDWVTQFMYGKQWLPGQIVFLEAGCSLGKNTYIEDLVEKKTFGKILILANRRANKAQIEKRLGITEHKMFSKADVKSYQSLEMNSELQSEDLEAYDMIVIDEAHYFLKDSAFNSRTNVSLAKIMNTKYPVKVFMSATLWDFEVLLCERLKKLQRTEILSNQVLGYMMKKSKQNIDFVACIDELELLHEIRKTDEGWLIFVDSISKGEELQKKLGKDAVFISAENSVGSGVSAKEYNHLIETEQPKHRIVIATSLLDNGVNIKDRRLRNIYIDCNDRIEMIQMLGRKRCIDENDSFKLFLPYQTTQDVWAEFHQVTEEIAFWKDVRMYLLSEEFPDLPVSLNSEAGDKYRTIVYLDQRYKKFRFNRLGLENLKIVKRDLLELCQAEDPFLVKVKWLFSGIQCPPIFSTSEAVVDRKVKRVMNTVKGFIGETLPKKSDEFETFMELFSDVFWREFYLDRDANHRSDRLLQPKKINETCEKFNIPLRLEKKTVKIKGKKTTHYIIQEIETEALEQKIS